MEHTSLEAYPIFLEMGKKSESLGRFNDVQDFLEKYFNFESYQISSIYKIKKINTSTLE